MERLFAEAISLHQRQLLTEAEKAYRDIIAARSDHISSMNNLALLVEPAEAKALLRNAIAINSLYVDAHLNLGQALLNDGDAAQAEDCFRRAAALQPKDTRAWLGLASVLEGEDRYDEAIDALKSVNGSDESRVEVLVRIGKLCELCNRTREAITCYERVLACDPNHVWAHILLGFAQFAMGDLPAGGPNIAWIWKAVGLENQAFLFADEHGSPRDLTGQTILLASDSGLGDTIQFVRYAALLKGQGAVVGLECQPALTRLLECQAMIDFLVPIGGPVPPFNSRVPIHNLIGAFGTTIETVPAGDHYLTAPPAEVARWKERLSTHPGVKVGLVWAGNPEHIHDKRRSIDATLLAPLTDIEGVTLVSLQKGSPQPGMNILDWSDELSDMADTAALIAALDLVISVDTSVAHLAGALGRPVWLLNRFDSCWRWLKDRTDSPWYATMRQFRQTCPGDWRPVIAEAAYALSIRAAARAARCSVEC